MHRMITRSQRAREPSKTSFDVWFMIAHPVVGECIHNRDLHVLKQILRLFSAEDRRIFVNAKFPLNFRPLEVAVTSRDVAMTEMLLENGADPDQSDEKSKMSLLCLALQRRDMDIARSLLNHGANPNFVPGRRRTRPALCLACWRGDVAMVQLLLEKGANVKDKDFKGYHAQDCWNPEVLQVLEKWLAEHADRKRSRVTPKTSAVTKTSVVSPSLASPRVHTASSAHVVASVPGSRPKFSSRGSLPSHSSLPPSSRASSATRTSTLPSRPARPAAQGPSPRPGQRHGSHFSAASGALASSHQQTSQVPSPSRPPSSSRKPSEISPIPLPPLPRSLEVLTRVLISLLPCSHPRPRL